MHEENIPPLNHGNDKSPIPVPPVAESWSLLQMQLDIRLPVARPWYHWRKLFPAGAAVCAALTVVVVLVTRHKDAPKQNTSQSASAATPSHTVPPPASSHIALTPADAPTNSSSASISSALTPADDPSTPSPATTRSHPSSNPSNPLSPSHRSHASARSNPSSVSTNYKTPHNGIIPSPTRLFFPLAPIPLGRRNTHTYFAAADSILRSVARKHLPDIAQSRPNRALSLSAGITVSESFPIGEQSTAPYSAGARSGQLTDYIPAPYFRLYKGSRLYLEATVHLNSPQYTQPIPLSHTGGDTALISPQNVYVKYTDMTLRKLYYMDIPLSIHYRIIGPLYLGAGLQYSRLWSAVGQQQTYLHPSNNIGADSSLTSSIVDMKDSQAYKQIRSSDWRALLEADIRWHRLTLSLQYQQAFSPFALSTPGISRPRNRNSSASLHLYFDLWIRRRH